MSANYLRPFAIARLAVIGAAINCCLAISAALAQGVPQPPTPQGDDPPARVGRLTALEGTVSYEPAIDTEWAAAEPNRPVTTGDRLWSDADGRAEIEAGEVAVRIWHQTELDITRFDDDMMQLRLPQGSVTVRVSTLGDGDDDEIDAPNAAVSLGAIGEYRVDVSPDGATTTVTVLSGSAEVTAAGSSFALAAHQSATIRGDNAPTYDVGDANVSDDFEQWSRSRDELADRGERRYVGSDMPGTEDLDDNGSWDNDGDYGPIWYPASVEVGWAPYHNGHWEWVGPWGWTWVDDAPWGWAPFHYGRWAYVRDRWGWCPGRVIAPAVFAPGLVVFVGGSSWGPGVGWFPLGPEEVYRPAYRASVTYVRRVNVTNVTNITNITNITNVTNVNYRNRSVANAVTVVPREAFVSSQPANRVAVKVSENDLRSAPLLGAGVPIVPTHASLIKAAEHPSSGPPPDLSKRLVVATHAPPPPPVPFAVQQRALAANNGRPLASSQLATLRRAAPTSTPPVRTLPIRSAVTAPPKGSTLTPARPGLPVARPALQVGALSRAVTPPPVATARAPLAVPTRVPTTTPPAEPRVPTTSPPAEPRVPEQPARPSPATPAPPASGATSSVSRSPIARPPVRVGSPALNASFAAQRTQMEARHVQQFAQPPAKVSPLTLSEQQESEHRTLDAQYHQAAAAGQTTMPPLAHVVATPPRPASPPAPRAAPRPAAHAAPPPASHKP